MQLKVEKCKTQSGSELRLYFLSNLGNLLGARACVELHLYEDAIVWCDKGLSISFITNFAPCTSHKNLGEMR